ncbi:MAG TPA: cytochrome c oxidase subunit II [Acidimicrobiales bacterium]|nr:cytochrome c oxidase subunit II [Acidimicrobiales bacterium]
MSSRSTRSPRTRSPRARLLVGLLAFALVAAACGTGELPQNTLSGLEGPEARNVDRLWDLVLPIAAVIFVLVQGLVIFVVVKFRARSDDDQPVQVHGNAKAEIGWTIVPALILAVVGVFTVVTVFDINERAEGAEVLQVKVIGHQWWWEYDYPEEGIVTANELVIPAGRQVQLELSSADVIHNFWPPKLAGKVYAIPGRINYMKVQADRPGDYSGQCAEYCGLSHANMRLRVIALSAEDFDQWVEDQQDDAPAPPTTTTTTTAPTTSTSEAGDDAGTSGSSSASGTSAGTSLATDEEETPPGEDPELDRAIGAELFISKGCSGCHAVAGLEGANGRIGPNLTHLYSRSRFAGAVFELNDRNLRRWLRDPPAMKPMNPDNGQGMPNLGLSEDEITQLIAYLETLK